MRTTAYNHFLTFLINESGTQRQINPKQCLGNSDPQNRQNSRGKLVALIKLVTMLWIPKKSLINSRNYWSPGSSPTLGQACFNPQHVIIQHHGQHHLKNAIVCNSPPTRTSEPIISHRSEHLHQLMLILRPLKPQVRNTWTPSPHRTPPPFTPYYPPQNSSCPQTLGPQFNLQHPPRQPPSSQPSHMNTPKISASGKHTPTPKRFASRNFCAYCRKYITAHSRKNTQHTQE